MACLTFWTIILARTAGGLLSECAERCWLHSGRRYADNFPADERERILKDYMRLSAIYRTRLDATGLTTIAEMRPRLLAAFAQVPATDGIFVNYGHTHVSNSENIITEVAGVPAFRAINRGPVI
jgi:hypothetical protein